MKSFSTDSISIASQSKFTQDLGRLIEGRHDSFLEDLDVIYITQTPLPIISAQIAALFVIDQLDKVENLR